MKKAILGVLVFCFFLPLQSSENYKKCLSCINKTVPIVTAPIAASCFYQAYNLPINTKESDIYTCSGFISCYLCLTYLIVFDSKKKQQEKKQ